MPGGGAKHSLSHWVKEEDDDNEYDEDDDKDNDDIDDNADGDYTHNWRKCSFSLHILNGTFLQSNMKRDCIFPLTFISLFPGASAAR